MAMILYAAIAVFLLIALPGWRKAGPASHRHQRQHAAERHRSQ